MQTQAQTPIPPPTPRGAPTLTVIGPDGATQTLKPPTTREELEALRARREQISDQLENVSDRRSELSQELARTPTEAARPGLEARIALLDNRILQLERDLATTGAQLSAAPLSLGTPGSEDVYRARRNQDDGSFDDGMAAGAATAVFFMSVLLLFLRRRWKGKGKTTGKQGQITGDSTDRLERLENGMDAIAIEIERISEGQRFVTKLLSESHGASPAPQRIGQQTVLERVDPVKG